MSQQQMWNIVKCLQSNPTCDSSHCVMSSEEFQQPTWISSPPMWKAEGENMPSMSEKMVSSTEYSPEEAGFSCRQATFG